MTAMFDAMTAYLQNIMMHLRQHQELMTKLEMVL